MESYLWIKAFHAIFMVTWFAGLFYLPRLFVYHAQADDVIGIERFKVMERKLYYGIMTPGAALTVAFGLWLLVRAGAGSLLTMPWFQIKLGIVAILIAYHIYLGVLLARFKNGQNQHSHVFYRIINEMPVFALAFVVILVIVKPTF